MEPSTNVDELLGSIRRLGLSPEGLVHLSRMVNTSSQNLGGSRKTPESMKMIRTTKWRGGSVPKKKNLEQMPSIDENCLLGDSDTVEVLAAASGRVGIQNPKTKALLNLRLMSEAGDSSLGLSVSCIKMHSQEDASFNEADASNSRILEFVKKRSRRDAFKNSISSHLSDYSMIAMFLSLTHGLSGLGQRLMTAQRKLPYSPSELDIDRLAMSPEFVEGMLRSLLKHQEKRIYMHFLIELPKLDLMFTVNTLEIFLEFEASEQMLQLLGELYRRGNSNWVEEYTIRLLTAYLKKHPIGLIREALKNLGLSSADTVDYFVRAGKEESVLELLRQEPALSRELKALHIADHKMFRIAMVLGKIELASILSQDLKENYNYTLYEEVLLSMSQGQQVQACCHVLLHAHESFWDLNKLSMFQRALSQALTCESRTNWIALLNNPLLLTAQLSHFLRKMGKKLGARSKELANLIEQLERCGHSYVETGKEEGLLLLILDRDRYATEFLEYAFLSEDTALLEKDFIEEYVYRLWDLHRKSLQPLTNGLRLLELSQSDFQWKLLKSDLAVPKTSADVYSLEFSVAHKSVYLRVLSAIFWIMIVGILEFILSLQMVSLYKDEQFTEQWLAYYFRESPGLMLTIAYFRAGYFLWLSSHLHLTSNIHWPWLELKFFHTFILLIYVIQMGILPIWFKDNFQLWNITQLMLTILSFCHALYYGLSLSDVGVILRIFVRMVSVTLMFGTISCFMMILVAFPIHVIFIQWNDYGTDGTQNQNYFSDLYTGTLTLMEFVFGAVIFVRPYMEYSAYTYGMTFVLVIFSFFGNIMLANFMVAFLANQFASITGMAKYYTLRMQYGLTKVYKPGPYDSLLGVPIPLFPISIPFFVGLLRKKGEMREHANLLVHRISHMLNIALPTVAITSFTLALVLVKIYSKNLLSRMVNMLGNLKLAWQVVGWALVGPFFLGYYWCVDMAQVVRILLNCKALDPALQQSQSGLSNPEQMALVRVFSNLRDVAHHLVEQKQIKTLPLKLFLFEVDVYMGKRSEVTGDRKYYARMLRKFVTRQELLSAETRATQDMELDLEFFLMKVGGQITENNIYRLVAFDRPSIEVARAAMDAETEADTKAELRVLRKMLENLTDTVALMAKTKDKA